MSSRQPEVVCSILEADAEATGQSLSAAPAGCGFVEIRGDHLTAEDLRALVCRAARPVIATVRRPAEGGVFTGSEEERKRALTFALDAGAAFVDVEWEGPLRHLAEGEHAARVILSSHGAVCDSSTLGSLYDEMSVSRAARLKIVPAAGPIEGASAIRKLLARARKEKRALAAFGLGRKLAVTRLMACAWGSWATYGSLRPGAESAPGQFTAEEMLEGFAVQRWGPETRRFALIGTAVFGSPSPAMHSAAYRDTGIDACYLPLELDRFEECLSLLGPEGTVGIEGLAVTMPFKGEAAEFSEPGDEISRSAEAINTMVRTSAGWSGHNTDGPAVAQLVAEHTTIAGARAAVVGAGGTAKASAAALAALGAEVTLFNRNPGRGGEAARKLGVAFEELDGLADADWDVLVQATPLGRGGETILPADRLRGRVVLDAVYGVTTPLIRDARRRGIPTVDGFRLLVEQAVLQFHRMTGGQTRADVMKTAGSRWLQSRTI